MVNEALRPAEATADWLAQIKALRREGKAEGVDPIAEGLAGLSVVFARAEEEAATAIALLLREALETPGRTAALVTPDAALARRVSARLTRWGVSADSSAGAPLTGYPIATLVGLAGPRGARSPLDPGDAAWVSPAPLRRASAWRTARSRRGRRALELALRGPRRDDWAAIEAEMKSDAGFPLLALLRHAAGVLAKPASPSAPPRPGRRRHGPGRGDRAVGAGVRGWRARRPVGAASPANAPAAPDRRPSRARAVMACPMSRKVGFVELVDQLIGRGVVRGGGSSHPRLRILGAIEARLVQTDLLILAGLEEGVWPQGAPIDPFLSRPMRAALGLPPPERRLGLAAHDFAQGASAAEVVLVSSERRDGAPAVASRWIWRLQTLVEGAELAPADPSGAARVRPRPRRAGAVPTRRAAGSRDLRCP